MKRWLLREFMGLICTGLIFAFGALFARLVFGEFSITGTTLIVLASTVLGLVVKQIDEGAE